MIFGGEGTFFFSLVGLLGAEGKNLFSAAIDCPENIVRGLFRQAESDGVGVQNSAENEFIAVIDYEYI